MPGDDLDAEAGQIAGLDPDLNEHGVVGVDVLGLHENADRALDPGRLADPGQLVLIDRARERARRALLGHGEIGLADRDDGSGRLLEAATGDVERHDGHHGDGDGEEQSDRAGFLLPQVAQNEVEEGHGMVFRATVGLVPETSSEISAFPTKIPLSGPEGSRRA